MKNEKALTLKEVADMLGVSYQTVYHRRHKIGFRLPGSRIWRVWPSRIAELTQPRYNVTRLALRSDNGDSSLCRSDSVTVSGGSIYARQAAKELDDLLAPKTGRQHRSTTTG